MYERRKAPSIEDSYALIFANLERMSAQIEENKELIRSQSYDVKKLQEDVKEVAEDVAAHKKVSQKVIEDHKFSGRIKMFFGGIFALVAAVAAFLHQTTEVFTRFKG